MAKRDQQPKRQRRRLLIVNDPHALRINQEVAKELGFEESVVFLQFEFLISTSTHEYDGNLWVYNTLAQLKERYFPWWSKPTLSRIINRLIERGLLLTANYNRDPMDQTRWFAINWEGARRLDSVSVTENAPALPPVPDGPEGVFQNETPDPNAVFQNGAAFQNETPSSVGAFQSETGAFQSETLTNVEETPTRDSLKRLLPPTPQGGTGAACAAGGGADAPGGGATRDWPSGTGDAASAADAAPGGAGDPLPSSGRVSPSSPAAAGQVYPESLEFLRVDCGVKTWRRYGHIPLPILERRWAAKQSAHDPSAAMAGDLRDTPDATAKELAWLEAERVRAERGTAPTPPELGTNGVDHVRNNQLRERLMPALHRHGLPLDFMTVLVWPTAANPLLIIDLADAAADAKLDALMEDLLPALVAVGVDPQLAIEVETRWGVLPQFPTPPPLVEPEAPAPGRAVERVTSPPADHRVAAGWSSQAAWDDMLASAAASKDPVLAVGVIDRLFTWLKAGTWCEGWIVAKDKNIRVQRELDTTHRQRIIDLALAGGQAVNPPAGPPAPLASPDLSRFSDYRKAG